MTSPWPTCIHQDDPTVCPQCVAAMNAELSRLSFRVRDRIRMTWLQLRHRRDPRDPF